jgi:hypothetical protein
VASTPWTSSLHSQKLPSTVPRVRDQRERREVPMAVIDFPLLDEYLKNSQML